MDPPAIGDQVERILRSRTFANKRQLRKLLEVLFKNMDSRATSMPDLVIGELWPGEIRTKRATDVATEMNRLRHALKAYYDGQGASDPVIISLPSRAPGSGNEPSERSWMTARWRIDGDAGAVEGHPRESRVHGPQETSRRGPKRLALMATMAVAIVGTAYVSFRSLGVPEQPRFGRLDGSSLVIMNAEGKELWRKGFPDGFGPDLYYAQWQPTRIWFGDLEGKGHTSVLFSYSPAGEPTHSSTLICYSDRGKEKWRWTPGRELPELAGSPPTFLTVSLQVLPATDKRPPRIVVSSLYYPWWPTQVALLDSNGKTISEYWHSGGLNLALADLDGDGREEVIATGIANGYDHQATLVVLDPERIVGSSAEVRAEFQIHGMGVAQERLRLLFPRSDLNRALFQYNQATEPAVEHGSLRLSVLECITPYPGGCRIYYEFDKNFRLILAFAGSDEFRSVHERFYQTGKNAHTLTTEEEAAFLKVRCLVGCKSEFVPVGKLIP